MNERINFQPKVDHENLSKMKKDNLSKFLLREKENEKFFLSLKDEVQSYISRIQNKKDTKYIYGNDDVEKDFKRESLVLLLEQYLKNRLLEWDLEYILNFIDFSFEIEDEKTEEVVFCFSDPYLNFPLNRVNVKEAIIFLRDEKDSMSLHDPDKILRKDYKSIFSFQEVEDILQRK